MSVFFLGCNLGEDIDCFKNQGKLITKPIQVQPFKKIHINAGVGLVIKESVEPKITLKMGENLIDDIDFEFRDEWLIITDQNNCRMLRSETVAEVWVETPDLDKIYSISQYWVKSDGVLTFPNLELESGNYVDSPPTIFDLEIDNDTLKINDNVSSVFRLRGHTQFLDILFWGSNGRVEGQNLLAEEIQLFHRSSNDVIVFPVQKIAGDIYNTGNLVLKNLPPIVEVNTHYTGQIIYP